MENLYENPKIEIIEINVEKGFATTGAIGDIDKDTEIEE